MELNIEKEKETPLLSRRRISATLTFDRETPSRAKVQEALAKKLNEKPETVAIRHVYQRFGNRTAKVIAHVYQDEATLKTLETKKGKKEGAEKKEEAAPEKK